jgi:HK97 family phage major capsid protein
VSTGVFNSLISRTDAGALIPQQDATEIIKATTQASVALSLFRRVTMSSKSFNQPVLSALSQAYWVNGDTGLKQTTDAAWEGVQLTAEELAAIIPIPDAVVADSGYPIWPEVKQIVAEAIGIKLDQAVFAGADKPASWPTAIIPGAIAAGNENTADSTAEQGGIANDIAETFDDVEEDGYDVTGIAARRSLRALLRRARDSSGQRLTDVNTQSVLEAPISYVPNGVFPDDVLAVTGQFDYALLGVRQDLTFKLLDQAVLTDDTGKVVLNTAQQDTTALRVVARFGFAIAKPVTRPETGSGTPFPFSILHPAPVTP